MLAHWTSALAGLIFWFILSDSQYCRLKALFASHLNSAFSHSILPVKWFPAFILLTLLLLHQNSLTRSYSSMHTFFVFPLFCECAGIIISHISAANISWSLVYLSKDWQHLTIVIWNPCYQGWLHCLLKQFLIFQGSWICSLPPLPQTKDCRNHISRTFKCNPLFPYHLTTLMKVSPPFTSHRCTVSSIKQHLKRPHPGSC